MIEMEIKRDIEREDKKEKEKRPYPHSSQQYFNKLPVQSIPQNVVLYEDPLLSKRIEVIESGHLRIERNQEEMRQAFKKMEKDIDCLEKLASENLRLFKESKVKDENYWKTLTDAKEDSSKKAITIGMGILLSIAVGILLPYFKSQKLAFVDDPEEIVSLLKLHQNENEKTPSAQGFSSEKNSFTAPKQKPHNFLVSMKFVNIRKEPSLNSKTILTIPPNQRVKLLKKYGGWRFISFFDHVKSQKVEGWAYYEFFTSN
tara:strand:+ start:519 stop:1292 length:774 start_codon:yes stop_codon:yes gene_type:complete